MPLEELKKRRTNYMFLNGNDSINFEINYRLNNEKLDTLVLVKRGGFNQKDFHFLLTLLKEKYGTYKLSEKAISILYKSNYKIKHIYWNNEMKSNFNYSRDIHPNLFYRDGESYPSFCYTMNFHNNSSRINSKPGYHIHATNKQSNEKWVFEVDANKLNDEYAKYQLTNFEFTDSLKMIVIEKFKIVNETYRKYREKRRNSLDFISSSINQPKNLPDDYIKIKYYIKKRDEAHQKRKINIDSLKKEQIRMNKNDI